MEEIVSIIKRRNNSYENLKFVDIIKIVEILSKIYDVYIDDVVFESDKNYLICYDSDKNIICVDYNEFFSSGELIYNNYMMLFGLVHEIRHALQYRSALCNDDIISKIYLDCFADLSKSTILSEAFYSRNHDFFPIEVNADIVAYLFIIHVAYMIGDYKQVNMFKNMLNIRIRNISMENYDLVKCLSGKDIEKHLKEIDDYNLFINGLLRDEEKAGDIISSLTPNVNTR